MAEYSVLCEYVEKLKVQSSEAQQLLLEVRDTATWERKVVKALISRSPDHLPDAEKLFIEDYSGELQPVPWAIKVLEELDPDDLTSDPEAYFRKGW